MSECLAEVSIRSAQVGGMFSAPCWLFCDRGVLRSAVERCFERGVALARSSVITLFIALVAVAAFASETATAMLEGSRLAIADGQWWRILTGHVTHWSADHLAWDLLMFVVLGLVLESRNRARYLALLLTSAVAVSVSVLVLQGEIVSYRGLSGVDSALFVAACLSLLVDARRICLSRCRARDPLSAVALVLLIAFVGKTIFEYATGGTLFVASDAAGFTPLPLAHVAGAVAAAGWMLADRRAPTSAKPPSDAAVGSLCS